MSLDRVWNVAEAFEQAIQLSAPGRHAFLESLRAAHPSLADEIAELLDQHEASRSEGFLLTPDDSDPSSTVRRPADLTPGTTFGDFEILEPIGRGGTSTVYRASQRSLGRVVALKVLSEPDLSRRRRDRFRDEAESIARCQHPGVIQVFAAGEAHGHQYLALELATGGSLARKLDDRSMESIEAATLIRSLAVALAEAHRLGILHRDLKPANILFDRDGAPKIADFGLAKCLDRDRGRTLAGELLGTPSYMAPEQVTGDPSRVGPAVDLHALGVILYEALTGRTPFGGDTAIEILDRVLTSEAIHPRLLVPTVPLDLETICLHCLEKDPRDRYRSATDLAADLGRFLNGEPIHARGPRPSRRLRRWIGRHPARAAIALAVLATPTVTAIVADQIASGLRRTESTVSAAVLVANLGQVETARLPVFLRQIAPHRNLAEPLLRKSLASAPAGSVQRLHASLALLPSDPSQASYLAAQLREADPDALIVIRHALTPYSARLVPDLKARVADPSTDPATRLRLACALADYAPEDSLWASIGAEVARLLAREDPARHPRWAAAFRGKAPFLRLRLAELIERGAGSDTLLLAYVSIYQALLDDVDPSADDLERRLVESASPPIDLEAVIAEAKRRTNVAKALLLMGRIDPVRPLLKHGPDPTVRSYLIDQLATSGLEPDRVVAWLRSESDPSARHALLLALGGYDPERLASVDRDRLVEELLGWYRNDPDAGLHGALSWLLDLWGQSEAVRRIDHELEMAPHEGRDWLVNSQGQVFSVVEREASDRDDLRHPPAEPRAASRFAIAIKEVTPYRFERFARSTRGLAWDNHYRELVPAKDGPAVGVLRVEASSYCNWLSREEGVPRDQWCYVEGRDEAGAPALVPADDFLQRAGYRLPTVEEWQYACRANATTPLAFGHDSALIDRYGWFFGNAGALGRPVGLLKPNDFGLFDLYGNAAERCERPELPATTATCGGCFLMHPSSATMVDEFAWPPTARGQAVGFRLARTLVP